MVPVRKMVRRHYHRFFPVPVILNCDDGENILSLTYLARLSPRQGSHDRHVTTRLHYLWVQKFLDVGLKPTIGTVIVYGSASAVQWS